MTVPERKETMFKPGGEYRKIEMSPNLRVRVVEIRGCDMDIIWLQVSKQGDYITKEHLFEDTVPVPINNNDWLIEYDPT